MRLWIDDVRQPPHVDGERPWVWVKTSEDAIAIISDCWVSEISFDHDLGGDDCGYKVAEFIESTAEWALPIKWHVHSQNPVGRDRIIKAMESCDRLWKKARDNG